MTNPRQSIKCPKCKHDVPVDLYCANCGNPLSNPQDHSRVSQFEQEETIVKCPLCKTHNKASYKFCHSCGAKMTGKGRTQDIADSYPLKCPRCQTKVPSGLNFCQNCGSYLDSSPRVLTESIGPFHGFELPVSALSKPFFPVTSAMTRTLGRGRSFPTKIRVLHSSFANIDARYSSVSATETISRMFSEGNWQHYVYTSVFVLLVYFAWFISFGFPTVIPDIILGTPSPGLMNLFLSSLVFGLPFVGFLSILLLLPVLIASWFSYRRNEVLLLYRFNFGTALMLSLFNIFLLVILPAMSIRPFILPLIYLPGELGAKETPSRSQITRGIGLGATVEIFATSFLLITLIISLVLSLLLPWAVPLSIVTHLLVTFTLSSWVCLFTFFPLGGIFGGKVKEWNPVVLLICFCVSLIFVLLSFFLQGFVPPIFTSIPS